MMLVIDPERNGGRKTKKSEDRFNKTRMVSRSPKSPCAFQQRQTMAEGERLETIQMVN
jgi:hypothetical protein